MVASYPGPSHFPYDNAPGYEANGMAETSLLHVYYNNYYKVLLCIKHLIIIAK